jgi:hypothetical protein
MRRRRDKSLLRAVCRESHRTAAWLLHFGADPNVLGWCELGLVSALSAACIREDPGMVALLLRHGADVAGHPHEPMMPYERVGDPLASTDAIACAQLLTAAWPD